MYAPALPALIAVAGALAIWLAPPAIANITGRRYANGVEVETRVGLVVAAVVIGGAALDRARRRWWLWAAAALGGLIGLTAVVLLVWLAPPALYRGISAEKDRATLRPSPAPG